MIRSMINGSMVRKCAAILALSLSAVLFLPEAFFAQGAVVGYAYGKGWIENPLYPQYTTTSFPTSAQLERLTHVIASDIGCWADGTLYTGKLPNSWNGNKNLWLESLVNRAHQKGLKVIICVGGDYFSQATNSTYLNTFVANIVNFVHVHGFDGVDIDWERPETITEWNQCIALLQTLRTTIPTKRITIALPHSIWFYPNPTVQQNIWNAVHAIHLMTYDEGDASWPNHSNTAQSINALNSWVTWETPTYEEKKKLFMGCAFYGYKKDSFGNTLWGEENKVDYATYSGGGNYNSGDNTADVVAKANHCRNNGYGGVFTWELGYDLPATNPQSLLNAIWDAITPVFTGPSIVCNSWATYTLSNLPQGANVSWDKSENLVRSDRIPVRFTYEVRAASPAANGPGWIEATIAGPCDTVSLIKHVWVGTPPGNITGPYVWKFGQEVEVHCLEPGQWATMRLINTHPDVTDFSWMLYGEGEYPLMLGNGPTSQPFTVSGNNPPRYVEVSYGMDGCSWNTGQKYVSLCGKVLRLVVHPNPASNLFTVSETKQGKEDTPWDLLIVNSHGIVQMTITAVLPVTVNASTLYPGLYILHARQGKYSEQHAVIVK